MLAVDTNVVVRLLTADDPAQAERARKIFRNETVLLPKTVLLETQWVLRNAYGFEPDRIADSFAMLLGLPNVVCEDLGGIVRAISWSRDGMDFADAVHLASAIAAGRFATFDRKLIRRATRQSEVSLVAA